MPVLREIIAVITGGSSCIGWLLPSALSKREPYALITSRQQAELDKAAAEIGGNVTAFQGDVSYLDDLEPCSRGVFKVLAAAVIGFRNCPCHEPVGSYAKYHSNNHAK